MQNVVYSLQRFNALSRSFIECRFIYCSHKNELIPFDSLSFPKMGTPVVNAAHGKVAAS